jgi:hypothetical protein
MPLSLKILGGSAPDFLLGNVLKGDGAVGYPPHITPEKRRPSKLSKVPTDLFMLKIVKAFAEKFGYIIFLCGLNPKASPTR